MTQKEALSVLKLGANVFLTGEPRAYNKLMKATYDAEADAAYVRVEEGRVDKTLQVSDATLVDLDKKGQIVGLEFLFI